MCGCGCGFVCLGVGVCVFGCGCMCVCVNKVGLNNLFRREMKRDHCSTCKCWCIVFAQKEVWLFILLSLFLLSFFLSFPFSRPERIKGRKPRKRTCEFIGFVKDLSSFLKVDVVTLKRISQSLIIDYQTPLITIKIIWLFLNKLGFFI